MSLQSTGLLASVGEPRARRGTFVAHGENQEPGTHLCLFPYTQENGTQEVLQICFLSEQRKQNTAFMPLLQEFRNIQTVFKAGSHDPLGACAGG